MIDLVDRPKFPCLLALTPFKIANLSPAAWASVMSFSVSFPFFVARPFITLLAIFAESFFLASCLASVVATNLFFVFCKVLTAVDCTLFGVFSPIFIFLVSDVVVVEGVGFDGLFVLYSLAAFVKLAKVGYLFLSASL